MSFTNDIYDRAGNAGSQTRGYGNIRKKIGLNVSILPAEEESEFQVDEAVMPGAIEAGVIKDLPVNLGKQSRGK